MKSIHIICLKAFGYDLRYAKKELYKRLSDFLLRITPKYQRRRTQIIAERWQALPADLKEDYNKSTLQSQLQYQESIQLWKDKHHIDSEIFQQIKMKLKKEKKKALKKKKPKKIEKSERIVQNKLRGSTSSNVIIDYTKDSTHEEVKIEESYQIEKYTHKPFLDDNQIQKQIQSSDKAQRMATKDLYHHTNNEIILIFISNTFKNYKIRTYSFMSEVYLSKEIIKQMPKRPRSNFALFQSENYEGVRRANSNKSDMEVQDRLASIWYDLSDQARNDLQEILTGDLQLQGVILRMARKYTLLIIVIKKKYHLDAEKVDQCFDDIRNAKYRRKQSREDAIIWNNYLQKFTHRTTPKIQEQMVNSSQVSLLQIEFIIAEIRTMLRQEFQFQRRDQYLQNYKKQNKKQLEQEIEIDDNTMQRLLSERRKHRQQMRDQKGNQLK